MCASRVQPNGWIDDSTIVIDQTDKAPLPLNDDLLLDMTRACSDQVLAHVPGFRYWELGDHRKMSQSENITGHQQRAFGFYWAIRMGTLQGKICLELGSTSLIGPSTLGVDKFCGVSPDQGRYGHNYGYPHMRVDADQIPWPFFDNKFAAVIMNHVIEHLINPDQIIVEALRVVEPGGVVALITPDMAYSDRMSIDPTHIASSEYSVNEFAKMLDTLACEHKAPAFDILALNTLQNDFSFDCVLVKR